MQNTPTNTKTTHLEQIQIRTKKQKKPKKKPKKKVASNGTALVAAIIASEIQKLWYIDSVGGMVISLYIMVSWFRMAKREIGKLIGKRAKKSIVDKLRVACENHDPKNVKLDVIRAYHVGRNVLVEVEVIMDKNTTLERSHDITMALQEKLETFKFVERAFVHVDYKTRHGQDEHKIPVLK